MQKITPHLWFDKEALEAADFYVDGFPNSKSQGHECASEYPIGFRRYRDL